MSSPLDECVRNTEGLNLNLNTLENEENYESANKLQNEEGGEENNKVGKFKTKN